MFGNRSKKIVVIFLVIISFWLTDFFTNRSIRQGETTERKKIELMLAEKMRTEDKFLFSSVTAFHWTKVCVFIPADDSMDEVPSVLGFALREKYQPGSWKQLIPNPMPVGHEYTMAWIFIEGSKITQVYRGSRGFRVGNKKFYFSKSAGKGCLKADSATIKVESTNEAFSIDLVEIPEADKL